MGRCAFVSPAKLRAFSIVSRPRQSILYKQSITLLANSVTFPRFRCSFIHGLALFCAWPGMCIFPGLTFAARDKSSQSQSSKDSPIVRRKKSRTPAQQKINSQLLNALLQQRGEAGKNGVPSQPIKLRSDPQGRVLVDIRATVSQQLNSRIEALGGRVVSTDERLQSTLAYLKLECLEELAASTDVKFIVPAAESATH